MEQLWKIDLLPQDKYKYTLQTYAAACFFSTSVIDSNLPCLPPSELAELSDRYSICSLSYNESHTIPSARLHSLTHTETWFLKFSVISSYICYKIIKLFPAESWCSNKWVFCFQKFYFEVISIAPGQGSNSSPQDQESTDQVSQVPHEWIFF